MLYIGSHVGFSKSNQLVGSLEEALSYGSNTYMFYTGAPQNTMRYAIDDSLTKEAYDKMKENNIFLDKIIVHAPYIINLANPDPEIVPEDAKKAGAYIIATGRSDYPNQINNSVCFPGLFRGTIDTRAPKITTEMKIAAAEAIAHLVPDDDLRPEFMMPSALDIKNSIRVAVDVAKVVIEKGLTKMTNIDLDRLQENIHSYFIDEVLGDVTKQ